VILFDLDPGREQRPGDPYSGPATGRRSSTTPESRDFDEDMLPLLEQAT